MAYLGRPASAEVSVYLSSVICYNSQVAMPANSYLQAYIATNDTEEE